MHTRSPILPVFLQRDRSSLKATLVVLLATLLLPMLVHQLPLTGSVPVGARLLPMFYAPFVAAVFFRPRVGVIAGLLAPLINHLLTGFPAWPIVGLLSTELFFFTGIAAVLLRIPGVQWVAAPLAYLATKVVSASLLGAFPAWLPDQQPVEFALTSIRNGWPGIFILGLLGVAAGWIAFRKK